jgi:hypothetical protein
MLNSADFLEFRMASSVLQQILTAVVGPDRASRLLRILAIDPALLGEGDRASRAVVAQALNVLLFEDLVARVPAAALYVERCLERGDTILHDHGAVRTVDMDGMGALPRGQEAILRVLRPLGYELRGTYPLDRLKMTGRSYAQSEFPEAIAQFFISELHVDRFPAEFAETVARVTSTSQDPLMPEAAALLAKLEAEGSLSIADAVTLLPELVHCFDRQHSEPSLADYEALLPCSAEMAWIATEGNAFNHATDRVADVEQLTREQKALGQPMKDKVETSGSGRVRQTAFHAARVIRSFRAADGSLVEREVPGSFLEFIARDCLPTESTKPALDLSFDPSNAQAIFKMTATA